MRGQARQYEEYVLTELHHITARGERTASCSRIGRVTLKCLPIHTEVPT
jgi:hypothetical protein